MSVTACATHAVLSGPAVERIQESRMKEVVVSNSIPLSKEAKACGKITVVVGCAAAGAGRTVDPRRNLDQRVVSVGYL